MVLWRWEDGLPGKGWSGQLLPAAVSVRDRTGEGDLGPTRGMIGVRRRRPGGDSSCLGCLQPPLGMV